ncbi:hypothetical protein CQW23_18640 [Capsicum baccatum]|uniref:NB-ARC domain-containing protein n=1 Tax=Capsicum baccatum TaxID=33114 RepID=A0A2G2W3I0_CAPBA|nr:hypothetical protein CQW23_18640 [Capsicum baccatum]
MSRCTMLVKNDRDEGPRQRVCIVGVWGTGGVGKTTLVKNLNNELLKNVPSSKLSFGVVVIWVTVPKPPIDVRKIQEQIASRLNLKVDKEASVESISSKICERLKEEKSFLLILDDVWEAINLDDVGVPRTEYPARSKVIITSRFLDVCKQMRTDVEMKVYTLDEDESWQLFAKNVGDIVNLEQIHPLVKEIARECDGLPLAITVVGSSMRGKTKVELWEDALKSLRMSEPHSKVVEDKVYSVIKWSFDSLESQDIELSSEQRRKHVNKKRGDIRSCFLYCSLYPAAILTDDLIHCWWAEGILGEHDTYEEAYNRGITLIESLKDACLLEADKMEICVKMHDLVRDVAIWIATSVKRISFVSNEIECLSHIKISASVKLLLQENHPLEKISHKFFLAFPALILNLSRTSIRELPSFINSLCQLLLILLQCCFELKELPPVANLHNLEVLDCEYTELRCLPQGMENLTNLRLLNMPVPDLKSISKGFFLKFPSIEMLNMPHSCLGATSFDEISSLHNLSYLSIRVDSSSFSNRDYAWMTRLKGFHIHIGETLTYVPYNKSMRVINVHKCEIFSNGELSGMLQFASDLYLKECIGLSKLIASIDQATLVNSEIPRVQKLKLYDLPELVTLVEPQSMWEHLQELTVIGCDGLRKLPRSLQTSKNIKIIKGGSEWWSQQEWDDENFKSNLERCYKEWDEMEELTKFRDDIKAKLEEEEKKGYKPKPDVLEWIENVHKLENEWETMQEECILHSEISTQARNIRDQLRRLIEVRENFGSNLVVEIYRMKKVEHIPGPSIIEGQSTATRNLNENEFLRLLEDDKVTLN